MGTLRGRTVPGQVGEVVASWEDQPEGQEQPKVRLLGAAQTGLDRELPLESGRGSFVECPYTNENDSLLICQKPSGLLLLKARGKQRTDSTHVLAAVREIHLTELIAETLRAALNDLATAEPSWLRDVARRRGLNGIHGGSKKNICRTPRRPARPISFRWVRTASPCWMRFGPMTPILAEILWERPAVQILRRVWEHHFERQAEACRWKEPGEWLPTGERVHSPYDPEAHFSDKRGVKWLGYKVHYTETCDQDDVHLIVDSETCYAEIPDVASTHAIQQKLAKKELCPQEHLVDAGYTDAQLLVTSQQQQITLIGPMRVNSSWQAKAGQGYDLPHFPIDWEQAARHLPRGQIFDKMASWKGRLWKRDHPTAIQPIRLFPVCCSVVVHTSEKLATPYCAASQRAARSAAPGARRGAVHGVARPVSRACRD